MLVEHRLDCDISKFHVKLFISLQPPHFPLLQHGQLRKNRLIFKIVAKYYFDDPGITKVFYDLVGLEILDVSLHLSEEGVVVRMVVFEETDDFLLLGLFDFSLEKERSQLIGV